MEVSKSDLGIGVRSMRTRKVEYAVCVVITVMLAGLAFITIPMGLAAHKRQQQYEKMVSLARGFWVAYMEDLGGTSPDSTVCDLLKRHDRLAFIQNELDSVMAKPNELGAKWVSEYNYANTRFGMLLIELFKGKSVVNCGNLLRFGHNSQTLIMADIALKPEYSRADLRPLAIGLVKEWIADRKAGRDPHADNAVEYLATTFGFSNLDVDCTSYEDTRKYFHKIPN